MPERHRIEALPPHAGSGQAVAVRGWVTTTRSSGKIAFVVLRDGTGSLQAVLSKKEVPDAAWEAFGKLTQETSVEVTGLVRADARAPGGVELTALSDSQGGADRVIECVGDPETWELAHRLAAAGGRVLQFGGCAAGSRACFDTGRVHYDEIDVVGAFHYRRRDVREAFELLRSGSVRIQPLLTHHLPLARLDEALDLARSRRAIKVAVLP